MSNIQRLKWGQLECVHFKPDSLEKSNNLIVSIYTLRAQIVEELSRGCLDEESFKIIDKDLKCAVDHAWSAQRKLHKLEAQKSK